MVQFHHPDKVKKTAFISSTLLAAFTASALLLGVFENYDFVEEHSSDIFVASCITNPPTVFGSGTRTDDLNVYNVEITASIKGTNHLGLASLKTLHWLNAGDSYLVFAQFRDGEYKAFEDFRVIPLGREFFSVGEITNSIAGKPENEQLQILFRRADDHLRREIERDEKQKQQLQTAIQR
jgi:hypothetical protein